MEKREASDLWYLTLRECNEVQRRHLAAVKAMEIGWGGVSEVCKLSKMSPNTVRKGIQEVKAMKRKIPEEKGVIRLRKEGGGRKKLTEKNPAINTAIANILDETSAGDPMSFLKWTSKSTYAIADFLKKGGIKISEDSVARILKGIDYSLQANKKTYEGKGSSVAERDEQFHYINKMVKRFVTKKQPVISVDTKKKELVGNFKNNGRRWIKKGQPVKVNAYEFLSFSSGKAVPYGTYDLTLNKGFVNVGMSKDTAEFAVESIRQWWKQLGKKHYPNAKKLLICADSGGSNGSRNRGWKYFLSKFAKETGFRITILHFPPATSKWNKIEHRLFSFISKNWSGKPLISFEVIINLIKNTTTEKGLKVYARLDRHEYKKGIKFSDEEINAINIKYHNIKSKWNYTIAP